MTSLTLSTFLPILVIVIAVIVWWRAAIVVLSALVIALLVIGLQEIADGVDPEPAGDTLVGPVPERVAPGTVTLNEQAHR